VVPILALEFAMQFLCRETLQICTHSGRLLLLLSNLEATIWLADSNPTPAESLGGMGPLFRAPEEDAVGGAPDHRHAHAGQAARNG
jgi:hypothetical protein